MRVMLLLCSRSCTMSIASSSEKTSPSTSSVSPRSKACGSNTILSAFRTLNEPLRCSPRPRACASSSNIIEPVMSRSRSEQSPDERSSIRVEMPCG